MDLLAPVVDLAILGAAVVLHEVGHGVVAYGCGDRTAAERGRLTLNPLRHVDLVGTVLVPVLMAASSWMVGARPLIFGWAKPVPIDPRRMRHPRRDMALVALAGPLVNLTLAVLGALALRAVLGAPGATGHALRVAAVTAISINVVLAVVNLLPILPLDGGRVLAAVLPWPLARRYVRLERFGLVLVLLLVSATHIVSTIVVPVVRAVVRWSVAGTMEVG